jgi:PST family polysaccharide transporter
MSGATSYRQILRSSSLIGGASVINILIGLLRTKTAAVLLGPTGVGIIGLFQSLIATASTISSLGFGTVGTRQIAEAAGREDAQSMAAARRALYWGTIVLATVGSIAFWALRGILAEQVLDDARLSETVGWLAIGVALTVVAGSQSALLTGLRRIGDIARISVFSALLSTAIGIGSLLLWGDNGMLTFVLAAPLASFLVSNFYISRLPRLQQSSIPILQLIKQWGSLTHLGSAVMIAGLMATLGQLAVRIMVQNELGAEALGYSQASWAISLTYIGFVLKAMGTDYYPRLTGAIHNQNAANRMVNEQTEVALLLAGPILIIMLGMAPWVIDLLYSDRFIAAASLLRWQVLGDALKVASWPLGFVILASGDGRAFIITEFLIMVAFAGLTWLGLPYIGIEASGIAYFCMYLMYLPLVYWLAWRRTHIEWDVSIKRQLTSLMLAMATVFFVAYFSTWAGAGFSILIASVFGMYGIRRLEKMTELPAQLKRIAALGRGILTAIGARRD